jgi:predicted metal-dependent HD superfamily phosphohydrolase
LGELIQVYSSPERDYHNLRHIQDCLSIFDQTRSLAAHPEEVELAIWFHDAVYDRRWSDSEGKSAEWAGVQRMPASLDLRSGFPARSETIAEREAER